ncbi:MAG: hypothetical protein AAFX06_27290 [Planctomycetota bacterium]
MQRAVLFVPLLVFSLIACDSMVNAQGPSRPGGGRAGGMGQQGGRGQDRSGGGRPGGMQGGQQPPWVAIFDADKDGQLSAFEIKNAAEALMKLDKNQDGKIGGDELRFGGAQAGSPANGQRGSGGPNGRGMGRPGGQPGGQPSGGRPGGGGGRGGDPAQADAAFASQLRSLDSNKDGALSIDELPPHMHSAFENADADENGSLNEKELLVMASAFRRNKLNPEGGEPVNAPTQGRTGQGGNQPRGEMSPGQRRGGHGGQGFGGQRGGQRGGGQRGGQAARSGQRSRPRDNVRPRDIEFNEKFPVGAALPDSLKLYNVDRQLVSVNSIFDAKYTVIVSGCLTCPEYRNSYPEIEAFAADYRDKGVQFYFLFQSLTHPENWGYVQPTSIQERFAQIEHAEELLQTKIPWLADTMDNEIKSHFAMTPNSQFVFDHDGTIVHRASWGRGSSLREWLEDLVGPSEKTTTVAELNLPKFGSHRTSPADMLIDRKTLEGIAAPLKVAAGGEVLDVGALMSRDFGQSNRYVKLRPEADQQLLRTGSGKLYLGFRQDPVLGAAWNNLATPPKYRITAEGVTFTPAMAEAEKLSVESDTEPREFLIDVENWEPGKPIKVEIQYFACNKDKGWCKPAQQEFTVWLEQDRTAGMVNGRSHFPGGGGRGRQGGSRSGGNQRR